MIPLIFSFIASAFFIWSFSYVFRYLGLVDKPNERKKHQGEIPLVGGISIYSTLCSLFLFGFIEIPNQETYLVSCGVLVLLGIIDDKFDLNASIRLIVIAVLSVWLVFSENILFEDLGDLYGFGDVYLQSSSILFTVIAVIASIVSLNMLDGSDGVLGTVTSILMLSLSYLFFIRNEELLLELCLIVVAAIIPFMIVNLFSLPPFKTKVFMGEAGSTLLGFTLIWLLLHATQASLSSSSQVMIKPSNALWLMGLPIMDMAAVILRRCTNKCSPFKADRTHIHHLCLDLGFNSWQTLLFISSMAFCFSIIAMWAEVNGIRESVMLFSFVFLFVIYYQLVCKVDFFIKSKNLNDYDFIN